MRLPPLAWLGLWAALAAVQIISPLWYLAADSPGYLSIARSLAIGQTPTNLGSPHLVYAVGYPLLICPVFWTPDPPFLLLSVLHAGAATLYLAGVYSWARRLLPEAALPTALLALGQVTVLTLFRRVLSEAMYMPLLIWTINAMDASVSQPGKARYALPSAMLLLALLALVRQAGILFAGGFGLCVLGKAWQGHISWSRAWLWTAAVSLPALGVLLAAVSYDQAMGNQLGSWSNLDIFTQSAGRPTELYTDAFPFWQQLLEGCRVRISEIGRLTIPGMYGAHNGPADWLNLNMLLYLPLCGFLVWGWFRLVRVTRDVAALTLPFYAVLHIYWPWDQAGRYFAPVLPVLFLCLWAGFAWLGTRRRTVFMFLAVAHMAVAIGFWMSRDRPAARLEAARWPELERLAGYTRNEPAEVQTRSRFKGVALILSYLLDRQVEEESRTAGPKPGTRWLIMDADQPDEAGFSRILKTRHFRLLRRCQDAEHPVLDFLGAGTGHLAIAQEHKRGPEFDAEGSTKRSPLAVLNLDMPDLRILFEKGRHRRPERLTVASPVRTKLK
jgi:hypothetical protein